MENKINIIIDTKKINNDDMLLTFAEIKKNLSNKTYMEIINFSFQQMLNNNKDIKENIWIFKEELSKTKYNLELIYLDKFSKTINKKFLEDEKNEIKNACLVIKTDQDIFGYNTFSLFINIKSTNQQSEIKFILRRFEFDNTNYKTRTFNDIKVNFNDSVTNIYEIDELIKNSIKFFNNDDYDKEKDKLLIYRWNELLEILFNIYDNDKNNLHNKFLVNKDNLYLLSKEKLNENNNFILMEDDHPLSEAEIKNIQLIDETKKFNVELENEKININKEIEEHKKELENIESNLNDLNYKFNDLNNKIRKLENEKININKEIEIYNNEIKKIKYQDKNNATNKKNNQTQKTKQNNKQDETVNLNNQLKEYIERLSANQNDLNQKVNEIEDINKEKEINYLLIEKYRNDIKSLNEKIINENNNINKINNILKRINDYNHIYYVKEIKFKEKKYNDTFLKNNEHENLAIEVNNRANAVKVKRFYFALKQLNSGYYKNFNLFKSIKEPNEIIDFKNQIPNNIKQKYKLNNRQQRAVLKAINTDDLFYLQGPPGTGKTQTLCAISECLSKMNKNIVMCSSTHEAINNFLERLSKYNENNPNIIIFKYKFYNADEDNKLNNDLFSENNLYKNFLNAIYNNYIADQKDNSIINKYIKEYGNEVPKKINTILPKSYIKKIAENIDYFNENLDFLKINDEFKKPFHTCYDEKLSNDACKQAIKNCEMYYEKKFNDNERKQFNDFDKIIDLFINKNNLHLLTRTNFDISSLLIKNEKNINNKISNIKKYYQDKKDNFESIFLNYIFDNNLINIIGVTTSSRQSIEINSRNKNLFSDYKIDVMLIDEISKSSTPEILAKSVLSKRIILSGDYRQLPPTVEFINDCEIQQLINFIKEKRNDDRLKNNEMFKDWKKLINDCQDDNEVIKKIEYDITNLFKTSFFVTQVKKLKNEEDLKRAYEFLQESWRFSNKILNLVNILYDKNEKLIPVKKDIPKYNLNICGKSLDSELVMVDTSNVDNIYFQKYHKCLYNFEKTFDQSGEPFEFNNNDKINNKFDSLYNQYSALIICNVINQLIKDNNFLNDNKKIGVITLTKSQKIIVKYYLKKFLNDDKNLKYIKVDTIDNFQGREEEIVIVDFIRGESKIVSKKLVDTKKRNLSFLEEIERINVAVSRAKSKLILIGAFKEYLSNIQIREYGNIFKKYYDECNNSDDSYVIFSNGGSK